MNDAAVSEPMLQYVVLHDMIVLMGVNADVVLTGKTEVHDAFEDAMRVWGTGNTVKGVVKPFTVINLGVSRFWGGQKGKVANDLPSILYHIATILSHIRKHNLLGRIAVLPLVRVPRIGHNLPGSIKYCHDGLHILDGRFADGPVHNQDYLFHLIHQILALAEVEDILEGGEGDVVHGLTGEEGLVGGDDDVGHHQQQGQLVVVNHLVGAVLVEIVGFLLVHVEGC